MDSARPEQADELALEVTATVDAAARGRVLILGSIPPGGRDLDLLARAPERERIEHSLRAAGLACKGERFALFKSCRAYLVELFAAESYLGEEAREDVFERALPIAGCDSLVRPAPAHALLILARLVDDEGELGPKRRARLQMILAEDTRAWEDARAAAPAWRAEPALELLERAARGEAPAVGGRLRAGARRLAARRPRRGVLVAFSGIDGAGKSSQARWLAESLDALDVPAEVVWNHLLGNRALDVVGALPKAALALAGRRVEGMASFEETPADGEAPSGGLARSIWSTFVTAANSIEQRLIAARWLARGRVVIFDRSPLDLAVRMQVIYRARAALVRRLVAVLTPTPDLAFLLDIPPEVSLARKDDVWSAGQLSEQAGLYRALAPSFGVTRLDGQRPPAELAAEIARAAWLALG